MERNGNVFKLDKSDVESAVMQFVCSCHPDVAVGKIINVYNQSECIAVVSDENEHGLKDKIRCWRKVLYVSGYNGLTVEGYNKLIEEMEQSI